MIGGKLNEVNTYLSGVQTSSCQANIYHTLFITDLWLLIFHLNLWNFGQVLLECQERYIRSGMRLNKHPRGPYYHSLQALLKSVNTDWQTQIDICCDISKWNSTCHTKWSIEADTFLHYLLDIRSYTSNIHTGITQMIGVSGHNSTL